MNNVEKLIAFILLIVFFAFIVLVLIISSASTKSYGLFSQIRIGQFGKPFIIYKVKTMRHNRVTLFGKYLRKFKIDELPQLFNILIGDMSFVGPRPDVPGYYDLLRGESRQILNCKPGLTSLAALKYLNEEALLLTKDNPQEYNDTVIFPDKVKMNLDYCKKKSLRHDLYIIGLTLKAIFVKNKITA
ncbi:sugar transferase [Dokdonia sp. R78006]|uniref:sugar transferase n=1 Tax=Dokdonia sp. R78006 TaxID=3093866 RepID=UPI0036D29785